MRPKGTGFRDDSGRRLLTALLVSFVLSFAFLLVISETARRQIFQSLAPVEVTRILLHQPKPEKKAVHKAEPKKIEKPALHQKVLAPPIPHEGAHHRVLTAKPLPGPASPADHTALSGGNAEVGKPIEEQRPGNATVNPPPPPPAPAGPTQDAVSTNQVNPEIPDELKNQDYKSFVRVKVDIAPDGSFNVTLRTSSGNAEIDRRVLAALKQWRWKPALKNGAPIASTQLFKFEFEVQ